VATVENEIDRIQALVTRILEIEDELRLLADAYQQTTRVLLEERARLMKELGGR